MRKKVLVTGGTGLVGSYLLKELLQKEYIVYAIARGNKDRSAVERINAAIKFWTEETFEDLFVLGGDLQYANFGLSDASLATLKTHVEEIFHLAASTVFDQGIDVLRKINAEGTRNIFDFGLSCNNLKKVNHMSTIFISGDHKGSFSEESRDLGQGFIAPYQQSKMEGEKIVEEYRKKNLWIDIFRPAIVIGESTTGRTPVLNQAFYQFFKLMSAERFDIFPRLDDYSFNLVTVDDVCKSLIIISEHNKNKNSTFHLFNSKPVSLQKVLDFSYDFLKFKKPIEVTMEQFLTKASFVQRALLKNNLFFLNKEAILSSDKTNTYLEALGFKFTDFNGGILKNIFTSPMESGFFKKSTAS